MLKVFGQAAKFTKNQLENGTQVLVPLHTVNAKTILEKMKLDAILFTTIFEKYGIQFHFVGMTDPTEITTEITENQNDGFLIYTLCY